MSSSSISVEKFCFLFDNTPLQPLGKIVGIFIPKKELSLLNPYSPTPIFRRGQKFQLKTNQGVRSETRFGNWLEGKLVKIDS